MALRASGIIPTGAIGTTATTAREMTRTGTGTAVTPVGGMTTPGDETHGMATSGDETHGMAKLGTTARTLLGTGGMKTACSAAVAVAAPDPAEAVAAVVTGAVTTDAAVSIHGALPVLAARTALRGRRRSRRVATLHLRCRLCRCPPLGLARTGEGHRPGSHRQRGPGEGASRLPRLHPMAVCPWEAVAVRLRERACQGAPRLVVAPGLQDLSLRDLPGCRARLTMSRDWRAAGRRTADILLWWPGSLDEWKGAFFSTASSTVQFSLVHGYMIQWNVQGPGGPAGGAPGPKARRYSMMGTPKKATLVPMTK